MATVDLYGCGQPVVEVAPPGMYEDLPEGLVFDESRCAMGDRCAFDPPRPVGAYLRMDPETTEDIPSWESTWLTATGVFVCEDCSVWIEEGCPPEEDGDGDG